MAPSALKHPSVPTEPAPIKTYWEAYVSTPRGHDDWLTTVNRAAPDGHHFLQRRCNIEKRY